MAMLLPVQTDSQRRAECIATSKETRDLLSPPEMAIATDQYRVLSWDLRESDQGFLKIGQGLCEAAARQQGQPVNKLVEACATVSRSHPKSLTRSYNRWNKPPRKDETLSVDRVPQREA